MIDLSKLPAAPWTASFDDGSPAAYVFDSTGLRALLVADIVDDAYIEACSFAALARNAFDVMMRRGWWPQYVEDADKTMRWRVQGGQGHGNLFLWRYADPFTALVEADKWYTRHEEGRTWI